MRGLLLLLAATASAQDNRGFVNQSLVTRNLFKDSVKLKPGAAAAIPTPAVRLQPRVPQDCAVPLLEVPAVGKTDRMAIAPDARIDPKIAVAPVPVCGKR